MTKAWGETLLAEQSLMLSAQTRILDEIDHGPHPQEFFSNLRGIAAALRATGELDVIAGLSGVSSSDLTGLIEPEERVGATPPNNAYAAAALFTAAVTMTTAPDHDIGPLIRRVTFARAPGPVPRGAGYGPGSPREILSRWGRPDGQIRERILAAHDRDFTMTQRLVYGSTISFSTRNELAARQRSRRPYTHPSGVPPLLWPEWATPLDSGGRVSESALRAGLAAAVLTVDNGDQLVGLADEPFELDPTARLTRLTRLLRPTMIGGHENADRLVRAVTELAVILAIEPPPIDYRRRVGLDWFAILTKQDWNDICDAVGHNPGGDVRLRNARRYLFQRTTLAPTSALPPDLAMGRHRQDAAEYTSFKASITRELQQGLDAYFAGLIEATGLHEPVTWVPDRTLARTAAVGRELEDINWERLHAPRAEGCPEGRMAREPHRTIRHCRWAGDLCPHATGAIVEHIDWATVIEDRRW